MKNNKFLVTGATGTVGRQVANDLLKAGRSVRILTRDASKVGLEEGVEIFEGDLRSHETLKEAFKDVKGVHFITFGDENFTPLQNGKQLIELVEEAGVKRVTVLYNGEGNESSLEKEIRKSKLDWTILRPQEFMANTLAWADTIIESNMVEEPMGNRPTAAVHEKDIGEVIARILVDGGHSQRIYSLTGPEVLTPLKQLKEIGKVLGRELYFKQLNEEQTKAKWKKMGYDEETINYLYRWYSNTPLEGYTLTTVVEQILGKPPRTFSEWTLENIESFK